MESSKITKIITIFLKLLLTLFSVGVCTYGVWLYFDLKYIIEYRKPEKVQLDKKIYWTELVSGLYMGVGAVVAIASCCFIYVTKNKALLIASCLSLTISVLALISLATVTLVMCEKETENYLQENLISVFQDMDDPKTDRQRAALRRFHDIEDYYHCCGVKKYQQYESILKYKDQKLFAALCCDGNTDLKACKIAAAERHGCLAVVSSKFYDKYVWGTALCSVTAALGLVDLILSFVLLRIRKENSKNIRCGTKTTQE